LNRTPQQHGWEPAAGEEGPVAPGICVPRDKPVEIPETAWKELVERHDSFVRGTLPRWRGREQDTVLVSQTVKDLVAGCGLEFEGRANTS